MSHKGNGNGHRGRSYGLMLLLAFGAALIGVMALHKLRERRIFNLLVEEKSRQLISLRQLLQKEKEYTKEMKRKAEGTKAKIYSLRNQKMELDRRLLEMQSTIDSLKDEQKTMESELEEKQKEIKLLRDKDMESVKGNFQVIALTATLKQKEAEIEDLKHRLESAVRVWSVTTDDPSNPPVNVTVMGSMLQNEKVEFRHEGGQVHESSAYKIRDNSTEVEHGNETTSNFPQEEGNREGVEDGSEEKAGGGQLQKQDSLGENATNEGATGEIKKEYSGIDGEKNHHANATERIDDIDKQEKKSSFTAQLGNHKAEGKKLPRTQKGGKKLEMDEISRISRRKILPTDRFLKKNVNSEMEGAESMRSRRRFSKEYKNVAKSKEEEKAESEEAGTGVRKEMDLTKANLSEHHNSEDMKHRKGSAQGANSMSRNHENSPAREVAEKTGVNGEASNYKHDAKQLHLQVEEAAYVKQNMKSRDATELEEKAELNSADKDEIEEDTEVAVADERAATRNPSSDLLSDSEDQEG